MPRRPKNSPADDENAEPSRLAQPNRFGYLKPLMALLAAVGTGFLVRWLKRSKDEISKADAENDH